MGERKNDRQVIDSLTQDAIRAGIPADKAKDMARRAMTEADRGLREQGKR